MPRESDAPDSCGDLLRAHRLREGLSQERLGRLAALSPRTIRQIESGRSRPRPATLKLLADALRLSEDEWARLLGAGAPDTPAGTEPGAVEPTPVVGAPRQLPSAPRRFIGRAAELAELDAGIGRDPLWVIRGPGGRGKTWLALRWAHDNAEHFPDGQIYINLRGFDPDTEPVSTGEALRRLLHGLNVDSSAMPRDTESRAGLYRSRLAKRRILVVLDNAHDERQVTALIPGDASCTTLITSRNDLVGLATTHGARHLRPGLFDESESLRALTSHLGDARVNSAPEVAARLVRACGGMPLAVGVLAARAAAHPDFPLSVLAEELDEETDRLDALEVGGVAASLRSVFAGSTNQLSPKALRALCLLGLMPTAGIGGDAAASLIGDALPRARAVLRELEIANLVEQHLPGRYRLHDLTRLYAQELSTTELSEVERVRGLRRLVDHYLHSCDSADRAFSGWRRRADLGAPARGTRVTVANDRVEALSWFEAEAANVRAAQRIAQGNGWHRVVYEFARLLLVANQWLGQEDDALAMWGAACAATEHLDEPKPHTSSNIFLGQALAQAGRHDEGMEHLERALVSAEKHDDLVNQAGAQFAMSCAQQTRGNLARALDLAINANAVANRAGGSVRLRGETLNLVGWTRALNGDVERAHADCRRALELLRNTDNDGPLSDTWDSLGYIAHLRGRYAEAHENYAKALEIIESARGSRRWESAQIYARIGDLHRETDEPGKALMCWRHARDTLLRINHIAEAEALDAKIADLDDDHEAPPAAGNSGKLPRLCLVRRDSAPHH